MLFNGSASDYIWQIAACSDCRSQACSSGEGKEGELRKRTGWQAFGRRGEDKAGGKVLDRCIRTGDGALDRGGGQVTGQKVWFRGEGKGT